MKNLSQTQREKVSIRVLSKTFRNSILALTMKISLYKEWIRLSNMIKTLKRANKPLVTVESVEDRYEGLILFDHSLA